MIDYHKELKVALDTVLPAHYEMTLNSKTKTPCISYMETNNYSSPSGETVGYSRVTYQVKVWANRIEDIQKYAKSVDSVMRSLGFHRVASGELYDNASTMIQKIMTYEALAYEEY